MAKILELAKYTKNLYDGAVDLASGKTKVEDLVKEQVDKVKWKARNRIVRAANDFASDVLGEKVYGYINEKADYLYVKNKVRSVLDGKYNADRVNKLPLDELKKEAKDAIGMHKNGEVYIPELEDIPRVVPNYKAALKASGKSEKEFKQDVQNYILMHELVESWYQMRYGIEMLDEDSHGRLEAMVLKAYKELSNEGYQYADKLNKAAETMHSMRGNNDKFKRKTAKYMRAYGMESPQESKINLDFSQKAREYRKAA